jgi:ankyrin repeat protein
VKEPKSLLNRVRSTPTHYRCSLPVSADEASLDAKVTLHGAAYSGDTETLTSLLETQFFDVDECDSSGSTALHKGQLFDAANEILQ